MSKTNPNTITIDGVSYDRTSLSDEARSQIANLQVVDRKIAEAEADLSIMRTARMAYANALKTALPTN